MILSHNILKTIWWMNLNLFDNESSVWPCLWPQNKCRSQWPIFPSPVILAYIMKTTWWMNIKLLDTESVWSKHWPQNECRSQCRVFHSPVILPYTGHSRYVDFASLDTTTYVVVIFHSQHFFSIFLCISTLSMSKTVNMKQRVSRGDFSCPRRIFYYILSMSK